ncbi:cathelicidin antimicrobial peptide [Pipra filicauda]|uniref:Cathelicidin antimicrobial peptide n=1 Tax=Pipra filicauda TaxID=649802 RepID=A0A6J2HEJ7_9PASS|nr:cathelicidin antimicrobial peptide [Pipra filicauda]
MASQGAPRDGDTLGVPEGGDVTARPLGHLGLRVLPPVSPKNNGRPVGWDQVFPERGWGEPSPGEGPRPPGGIKVAPGWPWGTGMPSPWALVLLVVLGGARALPAPAPLAYTQALAQAVDSYNQRPEVQNAFRLLSADPEPAPGVELSSLQGLNFTMMETDCAASARPDPNDCDFKENGAIKECSGPVQLLQSSPEFDLRCFDVSSDPVLIQRGRFGRFLGRVRRFRPRIKFNIGIRGSVGLG